MLFPPEMYVIILKKFGAALEEELKKVNMFCAWTVFKLPLAPFAPRTHEHNENPSPGLEVNPVKVLMLSAEPNGTMKVLDVEEGIATPAKLVPALLK